MRLPHFPFRQKVEKLSTQDDTVFAEASGLASLRLEQCIADLETSVPTVRGFGPMEFNRSENTRTRPSGRNNG
jgi:hypothetical protein